MKENGSKNTYQCQAIRLFHLTWFLCIIFVIWRGKISPNHILGYPSPNPELYAFAFPMTKLCNLLHESFGRELRLQRAFVICSKNSLYWGTSTSCNNKSPGGCISFYAIPMKSFVSFFKIVIEKQLKCKRK